MSCYETVKSVLNEELERVSITILGELKGACPKRTGEAMRSIHIEDVGDFAKFVGGTNSHLFFADQGNNQGSNLIVPVRAKALRFTDGSFHASASTYEGRHFVKAVADRHR